MPILDVLIVERSGAALPTSLASHLADAAGDVFKTEPGRTWVRLTPLDATHYAENGGGPPGGVLPVFVEVLKANVLQGAALRDEARELAERIADICDRPVDNVHILYQAPARGRVAFGGQLVE